MTLKPPSPTQALRLALPGVAQPLLDVVHTRFNGSVARLQQKLDAPKPSFLYSAALHIRTVDNAMIPEKNENASAHAIERFLLSNTPFWACISRKLRRQIQESGIFRVFVASDNARAPAPDSRSRAPDPPLRRPFDASSFDALSLERDDPEDHTRE